MYSMKHSILGFLFPHKTGKITCLAGSTLALLISLPLPGSAAESQNGEIEIAAVTSQENFEYILENRKDPFVPFISTKSTTNEVQPDEIVEKKVTLTGMQLFEPGQLNLVGMLKSGGKQFAMVEDFTGKGYIISVGTKIGRRGTVIDIIPNKVFIEETAETRSGRKIVTKTVMVLKKEGEE